MIQRKAIFRVKYGRRVKNKVHGQEYPVEIECYLPGKSHFEAERKYIATGIRLRPEFWNERDQTVNNKHRQYITLNARIRDLIAGFHEIESQYFHEKKPFHLSYLDGKQSQSKEKSFTKFFARYIAENPKALKEGTKKTKRTAIKYLKEFRENIDFRETDLSLMYEFESFLLDYTLEREGRFHHLKPSFIHSILKDVKAVFNCAIDQDLFPMEKSPFLKFKIQKYAKYGDSTVKYLTPEEVERIENLTFTRETRHLIKIRDFFLLGVYTGLRYGDLIRLSADNVVEREGEMEIDIVQEKTGARVLIPLTYIFKNKGWHIIRTYLIKNKKYVFDDLTNQYLNRSLKTIAKMAGIHKNLTCHMARHSCATILLSKELPLEYVAEILGHSSIQSTRVYAKVMRQALKKRLRQINF
jgi:integrase